MPVSFEDARMLNQLGVVKFFSDSVAGALLQANLGPFQCFMVLNFVYFVLHYLFASQTAQVRAPRGRHEESRGYEG
eukprot:7906045-Pyramimonas_sp.AAC.2